MYAPAANQRPPLATGRTPIGYPGFSTGLFMSPDDKLFRSHGVFDDASCNDDAQPYLYSRFSKVADGACVLRTDRTAPRWARACCRREDTPSRPQLQIVTIRRHGGNANEAISTVTAPPRGIMGPSSESLPGFPADRVSVCCARPERNAEMPDCRWR